MALCPDFQIPSLRGVSCWRNACQQSQQQLRADDRRNLSSTASFLKDASLGHGAFLSEEDGDLPPSLYPERFYSEPGILQLERAAGQSLESCMQVVAIRRVSEV